MHSVLFLIGACMPAIATAAAPRTLLLADFEDRPAVWVSGESLHESSRASLSAEQAHGGSAAVKLEYTFVTITDRLQYAGFSMNRQFMGRPSQFAVWVYGDASGQPMRLRISDASGETFQYWMPDIAWTGWQQVTISLEEDQVHWGGDGNGQWDLPLRFNALLVDSAKEPFQSVVYFDDLTYVSEVTAVDAVAMDMECGAFGNVYWGGQAAAPPILLVRNLDMEQAVAGELALEVRGPRGMVVQEAKQTLSLSPGETARVGLSLPSTLEGLFTVTASFTAESEKKVFSGSFAAFTQSHDPALDASSFFGACTHFGQGKGDVPRTFELMSRAGIKWLRDEIYWGAVEPEQGKYVIPEWADRYMRAAVQHGVTPFIIFDYSSPFYDDGNSPTTPEAQEAFGKYCYTLVDHFKDICKHWEVYNEPNIGFWRPKPDPEAYTRLLKVAYEAAKRADPSCTVVGVCTAGTDLRFIEEVLKRGGLDHMDALSIHPYRYPGSPEQTRFVEEVSRAHELMERYGGGNKKLWLTEIGWPTHQTESGVSEAMSANYLVRMHVLAMTLPFVERVIWYDFQDDGLDPNYNEHNFGLIRWETFAPKPSYVAAKMLTEHLTGAKFVRRLLPEKEGDNRHCYEFSRGGKPVLVAWNAGGADTLALNLGAKQARLTWADAWRETRQLTDGNLTLTLTDMPVFISGDLGEVRVARPLLEIQQLAQPLAPGERGQLHVLAPRDADVVVTVSPGLPVRLTREFPKADGTIPFEVEPVAEPTVGHVIATAMRDGREQASAATTVEIVRPVSITLGPPQRGNVYEVAQRLRLRNTRAKAIGLTDVEITGKFWHSFVVAPEDAVPPRGTVAVHLEVAFPKNASPGETAPMEVKVTTDTGAEVTASFRVGLWRVPRARTPPTIDGDPADWPDIPAATLGTGPESFFVLRQGAWTGPEDHSATARLMWDHKALYLLVQVTDDKHVQSHHGSEVWQSDNVQLALDWAFKSWELREQDKPTVYPEIGLSRTATGDEVYRWLWEERLNPPIAFVSSRERNLTIYEASIPWSQLNASPPVPGKAGTEMAGFALIVNEDDGQGRDGWLELYGGIGYGKDPREFGILRFVD